MTQIIAALTPDYVLLVSDRKLTKLDRNGKPMGDPVERDECKLVNIGNIFSIGYTGLADLEGMQTHEWIAIRLAEKDCWDAGHAARILQIAGSAALAACPFIPIQIFMIAGWWRPSNLPLPIPTLFIVTNTRSPDGSQKSRPDASMETFGLGLQGNRDAYVQPIGLTMNTERLKRLTRHIRRLVERRISPGIALRGLVNEVVYSSSNSHLVGNRVLACCLPKLAAIETRVEKFALILATEPNLRHASFLLSEPNGSGLKHFGPTFSLGGMAVSSLRTEIDPDTRTMVAAFKILHGFSGEGESDLSDQSDPRIGLFTGWDAQGRPVSGFTMRPLGFPKKST